MINEVDSLVAPVKGKKRVSTKIVGHEQIAKRKSSATKEPKIPSTIVNLRAEVEDGLEIPSASTISRETTAKRKLNATKQNQISTATEIDDVLEAESTRIVGHESPSRSKPNDTDQTAQVDDIPQAPVVKIKKCWHKRPENWDAIAEEAKTNGDHSALTTFESDFVGVSSAAAYQRLSRWKKDIEENKVSHTYSRTPSYGNAIDLLVRDDYTRDCQAGIAVDDEDLRKYLVAHLFAAEKQGLLKEEGGSNLYGHSWAQRFYKRHNEKKKKKLKGWHKRPENWDAIAEEAKTNGDHSALTTFESDFVGVSSAAAYQRLSRWKKDIEENKVSHTYSRTPSYGGAIDLLVRDDYTRDCQAGIAVDDEDLRKYLVAHLFAAEKQGLLKEEGGSNLYGHSWAQRFYRRHKIERKLRSKSKNCL